MPDFDISDRELSVALPETVNDDLKSHLIREDGQEDLTFALWTPSVGDNRRTGLVHTILLPEDGDRQVHGNASFNPQYFERACAKAMEEECGIAFLHSHPFPGWQRMSPDDIEAENQIAGTTSALTDLPLLGMTVGSDGTWSARFWEHTGQGHFERRWTPVVRSVGKRLESHFADHLVPEPDFKDLFRRTVTVWGENNHADLARLRIGIVGLGSVGSIVAETLARSGFGNLVLIDFDTVEPHNLDRLLNATEADLGQPKTMVAERRIRRVATASELDITRKEASIAEEEGYRAALDCDVLFSCVDRPRPRYILNHIAYRHLIPVVDGGIEVRFKEGNFSGADWQTQTVGPDRPCLACLDAYSPSDVSAEMDGLLEDPSYLDRLSEDHPYKQNENVLPFSMNLASMEVMQMVALVTGAARIEDFGVQRYRYMPGIMEAEWDRNCDPDCLFEKHVATGDEILAPELGNDPSPVPENGTT